MSVLTALTWAMVMTAGTADTAVTAAAATAATASADAAVRTISVRLHDYAGLRDPELLDTQRQVSAIYAAVGVILEWRIPVHPERVKAGLDDWPSDSAATLSVLIVSAAMARSIGIRHDVAGYAAVSPETGGSIAFIVAPRTQRIAESAMVAHARVLSGVVAHELAHLLMPNRPHSHDGIMRANWQPWEFRFEDRRTFSRAEADIIRRGVARLSQVARQADN